MAVLPAYRGQSLGKALLLHGEKLLKEQNSDILLWFNAREVAIEFYEKYGYQSFGDPFMIPNVCMHIVMYKNCNYYEKELFLPPANNFFVPECV